jgi:hypothetical protein
MCLDVAGVERGDLKGKYFCAMEFKYALKEITERSLNGQIVSQGTCQELRKE